MKALTSSVHRIGITTGIVTAVTLILYFLLMKLLGLAYILEFRFFNLIIMLAAVWYAITKLKHEYQGEDFYLRGMAIGFYTSVIAAFLFAAFMALYLHFIDPGFLKYVQSKVAHGPVLTIPSIFILLFSEGIASGAIITLSAMQFLKSSFRHHHMPE